GQWWRLFTAVWLHADLAHLLANATIGFLLLGLAMGRYGTGTGLLASYLCGPGGNIAAWLAASWLHRNLGAFRMVMGCLGLLAAQSPALLRRGGKSVRLLAAGLVGGLMLFIFLGLTPGSDIVAHFGGFVSGLLLGSLLLAFPALSEKPLLNFFNG